MTLRFYKYQGAGNDFVLLDTRNNPLTLTTEQIAYLCDRRFGIGADGLMYLAEKPGYDFEMVYFNSDGRESTMCGNGGRCIAMFANHLGVYNSQTRFMAIDGEHEAILVNTDTIRLKMTDVRKVEKGDDFYWLNTGSPHYVTFVDDIQSVNVFEQGRSIRYNSRFKAEGTNVNFVQISSDFLEVRTYERGVEDETFACGTGVVASAISAYLKLNTDKTTFDIRVKGGNLQVSFVPQPWGFSDIWLQGPAKKVFEGLIDL